MRARLKFTTDCIEETLVGQLKEHHWWPHFAQDSQEANGIVQAVEDSLDPEDVSLFKGSKKFVLAHTATDSRGTLSYENNVYVLRTMNASIHLLQLACETFVAYLTEYSTLNHKKIAFLGHIQIVEQKRKETIIQGQTLATVKDRVAYARGHKRMEFRIGIIGAVVFVLLLVLTFPWSFRNFNSRHEAWLVSIFEKLIGSVTVTTLISWAQYKSFLASLHEYTIKWSIPGEPEKHEVNPHGN